MQYGCMGKDGEGLAHSLHCHYGVSGGSSVSLADLDGIAGVTIPFSSKIFTKKLFAVIIGLQPFCSDHLVV